MAKKNESFLGDMSTRTKTTMVLPDTLVQHMQTMCYALGVPRNAWISMGVAMLTLKMLPMVSPGKKRTRMLRDLEKFLLKLLSEVKSSL